jgi:hypothetical protein
MMKRFLKIGAAVLVFAAISIGFGIVDGNLGIKNGRLIAQSPPVPTRLLYTGYSASAATTTYNLLSAPANGLRYYISDVSCVNTSSTVTALALRDGTTVIWNVACPVSSVPSIIKFDPPLRQPTAATAFAANPITAATTVYFQVRAYQDR